MAGPVGRAAQELARRGFGQERQQRDGGDDASALVLAEDQQVLVPGHDEVGAALPGTFQDERVFRITDDTRDGIGGGDEAGEPGEPLEFGFDVLGGNWWRAAILGRLRTDRYSSSSASDTTRSKRRSRRACLTRAGAPPGEIRALTTTFVSSTTRIAYVPARTARCSSSASCIASSSGTSARCAICSRRSKNASR